MNTSDNPPLTLTQKIVLAALAGALVGIVTALVQHHGSRWMVGRSVRKTVLPP